MSQLAPVPAKGSLLNTVKAVLWGFLGVRRKTDYQQDLVQLKPLQLMAVGVVLAFVFVVGLMVLVHAVAG